MKALLFSALLLVTSSVNAMTLDELISYTVTGQYVRTLPCYITEEAPPAPTHSCVEFSYDGTLYRAAVDLASEDMTVDVIYTPISDKFPEGKVPLDYFKNAGSI